MPTNAILTSTMGGPFEFDGYTNLNNGYAWNWICVTGKYGAQIKLDTEPGTYFLDHLGKNVGPATLVTLQQTTMTYNNQDVGLEYRRLVYPYPKSDQELPVTVSATDTLDNSPLPAVFPTFDLIRDGDPRNLGNGLIGYLSTTGALALINGNGFESDPVANSIYVFVDPTAGFTYVTVAFQNQTTAQIAGHPQIVYNTPGTVPLHDVAGGFVRIDVVNPVADPGTLTTQILVTAPNGSRFPVIDMVFSPVTLGSS